jgi:murein tripeptide amidase MpaA
MNKILVGIIIMLLAIAGAYFYYQNSADLVVTETPVATTTEQATTTTPATPIILPEEVIGTSVEGRPIVAHNFGAGSKKIVFVGGIHGGYEWNTSLLAFQLIDHLKANPAAIPADVQVTVIPVVNPDGLSKVVGTSSRFTAASVSKSQTVQVSGRFNANTVDLNRNFDCDWNTSGTWQNKKVSGGTAAFSEPESATMKAYFEKVNPTAVVVWYSAAGGVYSSNCHDGVLPETTALTDLFAKASGYPAHEVFNYYEITGDMVNWLAKQKIPAISVLLKTHTDTEWDKNRAGVEAVLQRYAQ